MALISWLVYSCQELDRGPQAHYRSTTSMKTTPAPLSTLADERHLLTTPEAAEILRLKPRTLEALRVQGTGPRYHKIGPGRRDDPFPHPPCDLGVTWRCSEFKPI